MRTLGHVTFTSSTAARFGLGFAWCGMVIYAASNSIATALVEIGADNPVAGGRNAITFQNLLLLGSVISILPIAVLFRGDWTRANLRRLRRADWVLLTVSAVLSSAVTPGLFFFALEQSSVTNVVLVSRIEPPLFLLAAWLFLKERLVPRVMLAGLIALAGALVMIALRETGKHCVFDIGEIAAALATLSYVASAIVARRALRQIPMGIFSLYRAVVGTAIYFLMISAIQGPDQFRDILAPVMLKWVWLYAVPVIVVGQIVWFFALKYARSSDVSLATSFSPLAGILFAMILLGEDPGSGFLPGAALIMLAIFVAQMRDETAMKLRRVWAHRPSFDARDIRHMFEPIGVLTGTTGTLNRGGC